MNVSYDIEGTETKKPTMTMTCNLNKFYFNSIIACFF